MITIIMSHTKPERMPNIKDIKIPCRAILQCKNMMKKDGKIFVCNLNTLDSVINIYKGLNTD